MWQLCDPHLDSLLLVEEGEGYRGVVPSLLKQTQGVDSAAVHSGGSAWEEGERVGQEG